LTPEGKELNKSSHHALFKRDFMEKNGKAKTAYQLVTGGEVAEGMQAWPVSELLWRRLMEATVKQCNTTFSIYILPVSVKLSFFFFLVYLYLLI